MRVLIAGGTGFIGRRLTVAALERGWQVHVLTRDPAQTTAVRLAERGARLIQGDLENAGRLGQVFEQVRPDHYFHNAGWYELGIPASAREQMWSLNVQGLIHALNAAEASSVEKIVVTSSTTALGDTGGKIVDESFQRRTEALSWYEHTIHEAQRVIRTKIEAGVPIAMGSPAQVIGPGDHSVFGIMLRLFIRRLLPPTLWAPEGSFSFIHVEDVAGGLIRIMEDGRIGENYFLAGEVMTNREMIDLWKERLDRLFPVIWLPRGMATVVGYLAAPALRIMGQPAFISPEVVRSSYVSFKYSDKKVRDELEVSIRPARAAWEDTIASETGQ